jgi:hypothetical protein
VFNFRVSGMGFSPGYFVCQRSSALVSVPQRSKRSRPELKGSNPAFDNPFVCFVPSW